MPKKKSSSESPLIEFPYDVLESKRGKMGKIFERHGIEWIEDECIESRRGECVEMSGRLSGSVENILAFLTGAYGRKDALAMIAEATKSARH